MIAELVNGVPTLVTGRANRRFPLIGGKVGEDGKPLYRFLSPDRISQLIDRGTWTQKDLNTIGLVRVFKQKVPAGQQIVKNTGRILQIEGQYTEVYNFEPIPDTTIKTLPTDAEKWSRMLDHFGLTPEKVKALIS